MKISVAQEEHKWLPQDVASISQEEVTFKKELTFSLERPLKNHSKNSQKTFDFYYFLEKDFDPSVPTIVYIEGGPGFYDIGNIIKAKSFNFLRYPVYYNIVHFHIRGSGLSQLPLDKSYDDNLRYSYIVEDIKAIQEDLIERYNLEKSFTFKAVIGGSAGAVIAHIFASTYSEATEKIVLMAMPSNHTIEISSESSVSDESPVSIGTEIKISKLQKVIADLYAKENSYLIGMPEDNREENLAKINTMVKLLIESSLNQGHTLSNITKTELKDDQAVFHYPNFKEKFSNFPLIKDNVALSLHYLLQNEISFSADPQIKNREQSCAKVLAANAGLAVETKTYNEAIIDLQESAAGLIISRLRGNRRFSSRVNQVLNFYNGQLEDLFIQWRDKSNRSNLLRLNLLDHDIQKKVQNAGLYLGPEAEVLAWDPANYKHSVPTLYLEGEKDTRITETLNHLFDEALEGTVIGIRLANVNHKDILRSPATQKAIKLFIDEQSDFWLKLYKSNSQNFSQNAKDFYKELTEKDTVLFKYVE